MDKFTTTFITAEKFPLVVKPRDSTITFKDFVSEVSKNQKFFKDNLLKYGAVLFRGFPIEKAEDFQAVIDSMGTGKCVDYIGGDSPRNKVKGNIYTSTEAPPYFKIPLHNELSFVKYFPSHIYFFCETPSPVGGETMIADARKVYQAVREDVKNRFVNHGLKYVSRYYSKSKLLDILNKSHKTWMTVLETTSKEEVEQKCKQNEFGFKWNKNDWLEINQVRPGMINHPETGEKVWFNQAHLYDYNPRLLGWKNYFGAKLVYCRKHTKHHEVFFADGTSIPRKDLYHVMDVLDSQTVAFPWQKGDVLALDNVLSMHGRNPFEGKRRILTAMTR